MHETALVRDVVHRFEDLARSTDARVTQARGWLGALSHLSAEHFREHFAVEARDTRAAETILDIEVSSDPKHPQAQHVLLESVDLDEKVYRAIESGLQTAAFPRVRAVMMVDCSPKNSIQQSNACWGNCPRRAATT